jgi:hypothetical protein
MTTEVFFECKSVHDLQLQVVHHTTTVFLRKIHQCYSRIEKDDLFVKYGGHLFFRGLEIHLLDLDSFFDLLFDKLLSKKLISDVDTASQSLEKSPLGLVSISTVVFSYMVINTTFYLYCRRRGLVQDTCK